MFPLSSALVFSWDEIERESVSMASKATRGGVDRSHVPTVRRVTPSLSASVAWEMRRDRRIDLSAFMNSKTGIPGDGLTSSKTPRIAADWNCTKWVWDFRHPPSVQFFRDLFLMRGRIMAKHRVENRFVHLEIFPKKSFRCHCL